DFYCMTWYNNLSVF
nr:immunoglobulin light chain junction region [Macaca mulatta]MOX72516.1 immunoglobulin light chain junction region [Macaca mulatta]